MAGPFARQTKFALLAALVAGASAFSPVQKQTFSTALFNGPNLGAGGMADTRDPNALQHEDPRKSISAAPSFEEYLNSRKDAAVTPDVAPAAPAAAPAAAPISPATADPIATLMSSQAATIQTIQDAIADLEVKPDFTWNANDVAITDASGLSCSVTLDARDAPGTANVAWLSSLCVDTKMSSLQIFNGPLNDVPHLVSRCVMIGNERMRFILDFRPRAYGAYEMRRSDGSYPGPEELGRKSFEYSGARSDFEKFGNCVQDFLLSTTKSLEGAVGSSVAATELDLLTRGPLYTCLEIPITDSNIAAVVEAREKAAGFWLSWSQDPQHEHRPGAPINSQFVYDTKYKQNAYLSLLDEYSSVFGPDEGKRLAVADSGPLDEAYVGGAS